MGSCYHLRFAASLVAHAPAPASTAAGEARLPKDATRELKDWS
jgi:hypothetical protein